MTEETYNKVTQLRSIIEKEKNALECWKKAVNVSNGTITLYDGSGGFGMDRTSVLLFMSFEELKDMAIKRLTENLEIHQKEYEDL